MNDIWECAERSVIVTQHDRENGEPCLPCPEISRQGTKCALWTKTIVNVCIIIVRFYMPKMAYNA